MRRFGVAAAFKRNMSTTESKERKTSSLSDTHHSWNSYKNQLKQIKGFKASHLLSCQEKNLHLNYSVQLPWDFFPWNVYGSFSSILKKIQFHKQCITTSSCVKKRNFISQYRNIRSGLRQPITLSEYLNSSYGTLSSEGNLKTCQLVFPVTETRPLTLYKRE